MPFFDRFWWLRALAGVVGLGFIVALVNIQYSLNREDLPAFFSHDIVADLLILLLVLEDVFIIWRPALAARCRQHARLAAMRGDASAMPMAPTTLNPPAVPDLAQGPLTLLWRHPIREQRLSPRMRTVRIVVTIVIAPLLVGDGWLLVRQFQNLGLGSSAVPLVASIYGALIFGAFLLVLIGKRMHDSRQQRLAFGIIASTDGLTERSQSGRERTVRWQDARLLELAREQGSTGSRHKYVLYGTREFVHWPDETISPREDIAPDDISQEEMKRRQEALLVLVQARTGLMARTFAQLPQRRG
jgi:hypothetical protein